LSKISQLQHKAPRAGGWWWTTCKRQKKTLYKWLSSQSFRRLSGAVTLLHLTAECSILRLLPGHTAMLSSSSTTYVAGN